MWMRGYNNNLTSSRSSSPVNNGSGGGATDHGQFGNTISPADSFNGRRLRPLIPKPSSIPIPPTCFNHGNCDTTNFFIPLNHPMATSHHHYTGVGEQGRRDQVSGHQAVVVSSRWNPTPDQLRALEELYRRGTRTPSADQIQHITAQLRRYGKIEGKNVFYWFQNHKARERQKRRRQQLDNSASSSPNDHQQTQDHQDQQQKKDPEGDESNHDGNKGSTTGFEIEQTKLWAAPTNCSTLADQVSEHNKPEKAAVECVADDDEWVQFQDQHNYSSATILRDSNDTAEEHRRRRTSLNLITKKNNANWNNIHLSLPTDPSSISFTKSNVMNETSMVNEGDDAQCDNNESRALTLELFPLRSNGAMDLMKDDGDDDDGDEKGTHLTSYQFFEFLPLKNSTAY